MITAHDPGTRVIIVTTFGRPGYLRRAMESGASGFMIKDSPADHLIEGIRRVAGGLRVIDPELAADSLSAGASPLTERESEVLRAAALGGSTATIAARVFLSEGTVRNYLSAAMGKLAPPPGPRPSGSPPRAAGSAEPDDHAGHRPTGAEFAR